MRYALTGASGFVGHAVVRQLLDAGHEVKLLMRGDGPPGGAAAEVVRGDLRDTAALDRLCADVDGLFHIAGWYKLGVRDPAEGIRTNVDGTRNVLAAAVRASVPKVVYTSTLAVNSDTHGAVVDETYEFRGRHVSAYDRSKADAHAVAEEYIRAGHPIVIVMPGLVYGPGDTSMSGRLMADVLAGRRVVVPAAGGVCWCFIDDVAAGHILAMTGGAVGESYMLAGPTAPLAEGLTELARIAGTRPPVALPSWLVRSVAGVMSAGRFIPVPPQYAAESMRAALATYYGRADKAVAELGWSSRDLRSGLESVAREARPPGR